MCLSITCQCSKDTYARLLSQRVHDREVYFQPSKPVGGTHDSLAVSDTLEWYAKSNSLFCKEPSQHPTPLKPKPMLLLWIQYHVVHAHPWASRDSILCHIYTHTPGCLSVCMSVCLTFTHFLHYLLHILTILPTINYYSLPNLAIIFLCCHNILKTTGL